jgi:hypothetical protein
MLHFTVLVSLSHYKLVNIYTSQAESLSLHGVYFSFHLNVFAVGPPIRTPQFTVETALRGYHAETPKLIQHLAIWLNMGILSYPGPVVPPTTLG